MIYSTSLLKITLLKRHQFDLPVLFFVRKVLVAMEDPDILLDMVGKFAKSHHHDQHQPRSERTATATSSLTSAARNNNNNGSRSAFSAHDAFARSPPIDVYIASNDDEHRLEQQSFLDDNEEDMYGSGGMAAVPMPTMRGRDAAVARRLTGEELLRLRWGLPAAVGSGVSKQPVDELLKVKTPEDPSTGFHASIDAVRDAMSHIRLRPTVRQILDGVATMDSWSAATTTQQPSSHPSMPAQHSANFTNAAATLPRLASVRDGVDESYLRTLKELHVDDVFYSIRERERANEESGVRLHESDLATLPMAVIRYRMRCATLYRRRGHGASVRRDLMTSTGGRPMTFPTPSIPTSQALPPSCGPTSSRSASAKAAAAGAAENPS
jgi:hypothetical protein